MIFPFSSSIYTWQIPSVHCVRVKSGKSTINCVLLYLQPLLSFPFLSFCFPSSQAFFFIQTLQHIENSNSFLLLCKEVHSSTVGFNLKDICETFCCCCGERNSYLFISLLCISWIKVLCVPPPLFFLAWETSHPDLMFFFWRHMKIFSSFLMPPTRTVFVFIVYVPPSLPPSLFSSLPHSLLSFVKVGHKNQHSLPGLGHF